MNKKQKFARSYLQKPLTPLERELKAARSLEKLLASLPKKLNVKPEPTYKPNHNLQNL
jgi:hypothetical protein